MKKELQKEIKTENMKEKLTEIFSDEKNWEKRIEIDGYTFMYQSYENMCRVFEQRKDYSVALPVFCFAYGKFMWCC